MATNATKTSVSKPSFASIAAMAPPTPNGQPRIRKETKHPLPELSPNIPDKVAPVESPSAHQLHRELHSSMSRLAVKDPSLSTNPLNDHQKNNISRAGLRFDDDRTQISTSSTKPASLDGKSTTSGTTFALDEKESLRPDDSASVKAGEDDEFGSGPASGAQNSRVGSEAGSRAFRDQFYEITENIGTGSHRIPLQGRRIITGIEEEGPQVTHSPHVPANVPVLTPPVNVPPPQLATVNGSSIDYKYQEPDEKLIEALASPKDRLFLLRLEQEVVAFIQDPSGSPMIDLPPCNSFCRLLAHKLADYYALTHFVDNAVTSVRLYRTPYCRIRTPLSAIPTAPATIDAAISSQPAMKIMRRTGLDKDGQNNDSGVNTTDGSVAPSKACSENGNDSQQGTGVVSPNDSVVAKEKSAMTREEREAIYKETRERIFGPNGENAESTEAVNEASRTSSRNEKRKKKHKHNDDGFTARSQYNVYYPSMPYATATYEQDGDPSNYYNPYALQCHNVVPQHGFLGPTDMQQQGFQQDYHTMGNPQSFSNAMTGNPMIHGYESQNSTGYSPNMSQQYYPQMQQAMGMGMGMGQQSPVIPSPAMSNNGQFSVSQPQLSGQEWIQDSYPYPYQQPRDQQQYFAPQTQIQNPITGLRSVPYQYGQLPMQPGVNGVKAQHPLPGSYKGQSFNPQTRAFVPNSGPVPSQMSHHASSPNHTISRSPVISYQNGNQYPGYNSQAIYTQVASLPTSHTYNLSHDPKNNGARKSSAHSNTTQSPALSSLSKWGTPAHLPPKPPPPEAPSMPEGQHSLPLNNRFNANVQPLHGGQPMPSYQNGVYSLPNTNPQ